MKLFVRPSPQVQPGGFSIFGLARLAEWICGAVALACFAYVTSVVIDERAFQARQSKRLATLVETALHPDHPAAEARRPARRQVHTGDPIGRLEIASVGISSIVTDGVDELTLQRGIGWMPDTALPGEPGNVAMAGHRDTFFRGLRDLKLGDEIHLATPTGDFDYRVDSLRVVTPEEIGVLASTAEPTLTLVTCYPFSYLGAAPMRYIVRARQVTKNPDPPIRRGIH